MNSHFLHAHAWYPAFRMSKGRMLFCLGLLVCAAFWFTAIHARMTYLESLEVGYQAPNSLPMGRIVRDQMMGAALATALFLGITCWRLIRRSGCAAINRSRF
jgi:hypothetical protein